MKEEIILDKFSQIPNVIRAITYTREYMKEFRMRIPRPYLRA